MTLKVCGCLALLVGGTCVSNAADPAFPQDRHLPFPLPSTAANDVRQLATDPRGRLWAATADGLYLLHADPAGPRWERVPNAPGGASFGVAVDTRGAVWCAHWNGLWRLDGEQARAIRGVPGPVRAVAVNAAGTVLAGGPDGYHLVTGENVQRLELQATRYLNAIVATPGRTNEWWLATGMGLFHWDGPGAGHYQRVPIDRVSLAVTDVASAADGSEVWAAALGGVQRFRGGRWVTTLSPAEGVPSSEVRAVTRDREGVLWLGTAVGVARQAPEGDPRRWDVRHGRRWLLSDDVRDVIPRADGGVWVATAAGVSALVREPQTLEAKAREFHRILEARHVRLPGIVEKCLLRTPGDLTTWGPMDDDNDGGYTALALAMESYRYAATRDPAALAAARRAFAACEFLQRVTGTPGFLARTVVPIDWTEMHDPNENLSDEAWAARRVSAPREKRITDRWRRSADGRWWWKGDTSSDELTAHFFGYYVFHEFAADTADRARIREQVVRLAGHLLEHGFVLRDLDGRPTRWAIWAPERLNGDPDWAMERGINSVEVLSFLKFAHHVSGEARFAEAYQRLITEHRYDENVRLAPNLNPAWRTYIDLELLAFAYPALLALEQDPALRRVYRQSFERWHETISADGNPFFEFLYAAHGSRGRARLEEAMAFLRETPMDLIRWDVDLSVREDLRQVRSPEVEHWQVDQWRPVAELGYSRTDQNPWRVRQGDGGRTESDGVFWLLPYWMGRQQGLIPGAATKEP